MDWEDECESFARECDQLVGRRRALRDICESGTYDPAAFENTLGPDMSDDDVRIVTTLYGNLLMALRAAKREPVVGYFPSDCPSPAEHATEVDLARLRQPSRSCFTAPLGPVLVSAIPYCLRRGADPSRTLAGLRAVFAEDLAALSAASSTALSTAPSTATPTAPSTATPTASSTAAPTASSTAAPTASSTALSTAPSTARTALSTASSTASTASSTALSTSSTAPSTMLAISGAQTPEGAMGAYVATVAQATRSVVARLRALGAAVVPELADLFDGGPSAL